jgi:hypothetical protein
MGGRPAQELPPAQEQAIIALLREPTVAKAAETSGVPASTMYRWLKEPGFRAAYREGRRESYSHAVSLVQSYVPHAVQSLMKMVADLSTPPAVRATCCGMLLKFGRESIDQDEMIGRIEALEASQEKKP